MPAFLIVRAGVLWIVGGHDISEDNPNLEPRESAIYELDFMELKARHIPGELDGEHLPLAGLTTSSKNGQEV